MKKRGAIFLGLLVITALIGFFFVKNQLSSTNFQQVEFEKIEFEHPDSTQEQSSLVLLDSTAAYNQEEYTEDTIITIDNPLSHHYKKHLAQKKSFQIKNSGKLNTPQDSTSNLKTKKTDVIVSSKGRAIKYQELPLHNLPNKRIQFSTFFRTFNPGDYINGKELAAYYWNDKNLNYVTRKTVSSYVEKNIKKLTRIENTLIIETNSTNGIDTKVSIPFIEKMHMMIQDSATITFGNTIQSKETLFKNALLLPIQTTGITVISNGNLIPPNGFVSGDFYFTEYAASKGGFSLK